MTAALRAGYCPEHAESRSVCGCIGETKAVASVAEPRARYFVLSGCYRAEFRTFGEALEWKRAQGGDIVGDGYDCDADEDGFRVCSDGLTEDERAQLEGL